MPGPRVCGVSRAVFDRVRGVCGTVELINPFYIEVHREAVLMVPSRRTRDATALWLHRRGGLAAMIAPLVFIRYALSPLAAVRLLSDAHEVGEGVVGEFGQADLDDYSHSDDLDDRPGFSRPSGKDAEAHVELMTQLTPYKELPTAGELPLCLDLGESFARGYLW